MYPPVPPLALRTTFGPMCCCRCCLCSHRGWPHEAAVNGTGARPGGEPGAPSPAGGGTRGPSLHVTFGVETTLSGTYESLLHHALEVAAVEHPLLFGLPPSGGETEAWKGTTAVSAACVD